MKKLFVIALLSWPGPGNSIVIKHHNFTSYYNKVKKEADSVSWDLTPEMVSCANVTRKNPFKRDPLLSESPSGNDYAVNNSDKNSKQYNPDRAEWIDEGHLFSYQSAMCTPFGMFECFYMTNMLPQFHAFNAGDWKTLEVQERIWAKTQILHEVAGGYGVMSADTARYGTYAVKLFPNGCLPSGEVIPAYMWKAICFNGKYSVWIMPNNKHSIRHNYNTWLTNVHSFDLTTIAAEIKRLKI